MVQFPESRSIRLCIQRIVTDINQPGYPIRESSGFKMFAPNRGFSQLATPFFAG